MVLCLMVNCHSRTVRDKEISFFRVPVIVKNQGEAYEELSVGGEGGGCLPLAETV